MKYFDSLIDIYAQTQLRTNLDNSSSEVAKEALRSVIIEEIITEHEKNLRTQIKKEVEKEFKIKLHRERIRQIKSILIESVFIATFVGLMVNQATDLITYMKNENEKIVCITIGLILLLVCALASYIKFVYVDRITIFLEDYLKKRK